MRTRLIGITFLVASIAFSSSGFCSEFAFLVGVGDYDIKQLRKLDYSRPDVVDFRQTLLQSGFSAENIVLLHDDLQTLSHSRYLAEGAKIRKEFKVLLETLEEEDTLIVALAGHGVQFQGDALSYFCPLDANLDDKSTLISLKEMMDSLSRSKPRLKLMLVDACRNDPASRLRRSTGGPELESVSLPVLAEDPQGLVTLFSCATGQEALEHPDLGHGIFFYHVLEAFKGTGDVDQNGELTLDELLAFTKDRTRTYARTTFGASQTPRQIGSVDGAWIIRDLKPFRDLEEVRRELQEFEKLTAKGAPASEYLQPRANQRLPAWRALADRSVPEACYLLARCYQLGVGGLPKDEQEAVKLYRQAADQGFAPAQNNLGYCYHRGDGIAQDLTEAVRYYRFAARQGFAAAQNNLGNCYYRGDGVAQDPVEAVRYYRMAAGQGHAVAQVNLGARYQDGKGVVQDPAEAVRYYRLAADQGYADAQNNLGNCYYRGDGIAQHLTEAVRYYRLAAAQGHAVAQVNLGARYQDGKGVVQDPAEAVRLYRLAADQGDAMAQYNLGWCYQHDTGVPKDLREAVRYYRLAADQGLEDAQKALQQLGVQ